jgi:hypothetical protein
MKPKKLLRACDAAESYSAHGSISNLVNYGLKLFITRGDRELCEPPIVLFANG